MAAEEKDAESLESNEFPQPIEPQQPQGQENLASSSIQDTATLQDILPSSSPELEASTQQEPQNRESLANSPTIAMTTQLDTLSPPPPADTTAQNFAIVDTPLSGASGASRELVNMSDEYQSYYAIPPTRSPRQFSRAFIVSLVAVLLILLSTGAYSVLLRPRLPASSAFVRITPISRTVTDNYTLTIATGNTDPTKNPIGAHWLAHTTSAQSMNVAATGQGHQDATSATGTVMVAVEQAGKSPTPLENMHIVSQSGVKIVIQGVNTVLVSLPRPQGPVTSPYEASAEDPGANGNIPAYDINGTYRGIDDPSLVLFLQNPQPFTGGKDARDYKFVQQSDIDTAASTLENKLTDEIPAVKATVQNQLAANEQLIDGVQCNPRVTSNHQANDEAANVTVKVVVECTGTAYNVGKLVDLADTELKLHEDPQQGADYARVGEVVAKILANTVSSEGNKAVTCTLQAGGTWVYQINRMQQQHLANLIAGLPQADAKTRLLSQGGIAAVTIQTSGGLGVALPSAGKDIQIIISSVKGV